MLKLADVSKYFNYLLSVVAFSTGIVLATGIVYDYVPLNLRLTFGIVLILVGIYRFVLTRSGSRRQREEEE